VPIAIPNHNRKIDPRQFGTLVGITSEGRSPSLGIRTQGKRAEPINRSGKPRS
jgi:hypothetical protein